MYRGVICFACIKIASTLASSLACAFFALCLFVAFRLSFGFAFPLFFSYAFALACFSFMLSCYAIVSAPCSVNAKRGNIGAGGDGGTAARGTHGGACPALPDCLCYRGIIKHYARALLAWG